MIPYKISKGPRIASCKGPRKLKFKGPRRHLFKGPLQLKFKGPVPPIPSEVPIYTASVVTGYHGLGSENRKAV